MNSKISIYQSCNHHPNDQEDHSSLAGGGHVAGVLAAVTLLPVHTIVLTIIILLISHRIQYNFLTKTPQLHTPVTPVSDTLAHLRITCLHLPSPETLCGFYLLLKKILCCSLFFFLFNIQKSHCSLLFAQNLLYLHMKPLGPCLTILTQNVPGV